MQFSFSVTRSLAGETVVALKGTLNENATLINIPTSGTKKLTVDLGELVTVNSVGTVKFVSWLKTMSTTAKPHSTEFSGGVWTIPARWLSLNLQYRTGNRG